eukprot:m.41723 g.41723  ORF g.41723 m.41723 type:complete len:648 (+) comp10605_c0_seq2:143-2086(+)
MEPSAAFKRLAKRTEITAPLEQMMSCNGLVNSATALIREAHGCVMEPLTLAHAERAYISYVKVVTIVMERLPLHAKFSDFRKTPQFQAINRKASHCLELAEVLKPRLLKLYKVEYDRAQQQQKRQREQRGHKEQSEQGIGDGWELLEALNPPTALDHVTPAPLPSPTKATIPKPSTSTTDACASQPSSQDKSNAIPSTEELMQRLAAITATTATAATASSLSSPAASASTPTVPPDTLDSTPTTVSPMLAGKQQPIQAHIQSRDETSAQHPMPYRPSSYEPSQQPANRLQPHVEPVHKHQPASLGDLYAAALGTPSPSSSQQYSSQPTLTTSSSQPSSTPSTTTATDTYNALVKQWTSSSSATSTPTGAPGHQPFQPHAYQPATYTSPHTTTTTNSSYSPASHGTSYTPFTPYTPYAPPQQPMSQRSSHSRTHRPAPGTSLGLGVDLRAPAWHGDTYRHQLHASATDSTCFRPVIIAQGAILDFLKRAKANSTNNKETCGVLAGKIGDDGVLTISHIIIPKQTGSSDCCTMTEEGETSLFAYQSEHDLITMGWVHTHPSQTAFLSSVDLHTSFPFQIMMPEALAIVCSVKYSDTQAFHLTPRGMSDIGRCRERGFHPHTNADSLFQPSSHVFTTPPATAPCAIIDLR